MSQKQLAEMLKVSQGSVGNWEAGTREPKFSMLIHIADFFGVSTDYLIGHLSDAGNKENRMHTDVFSDLESNHIKKYRRLDNRNRQTIDITIDSMLITQEKEKTG